MTIWSPHLIEVIVWFILSSSLKGQFNWCLLRQRMGNAVYDIGGSSLRVRTVQAVKTCLALPQPRLPDLVFSDAKGMALWSRIQHLPHYYQARDEIDLLRKISPAICSRLQKEVTVIDLGAGYVSQ